MTYIVIGSENCTRCEILCKTLDNDGIEYEYKYYEHYSEEKQECILKMANRNGIGTFPLIYDTGSKDLIVIEDLFK